uniref:NAD(+) synthase n=1 Tax=Alistipes sp. TaxID=1872444 RepID=UPI004056617C
MDQHGYIKVAAGIPAIRVADCRFNANEIEKLIREAHEQGVALILFPELSLTGATIGDLVRQSTLLRAAEEELSGLVERSKGWAIAACVGMPISTPMGIFNCAVFFAQGKLLGVVPKSHLSNHGPSSEGRWFRSGKKINEEVISLIGEEVPFGPDLLLEINGVKCGVEFGEEVLLPAPPSIALAMAGAEVILNLSALPETVGKWSLLRQAISIQSYRLHCGYLYASAGFGESSTDLSYVGHALISDQGEELRCGDRDITREPHTLAIASIDVEYIRNERNRLNIFEGAQMEQKQRVVSCQFATQESYPCRYFNPFPFVSRRMDLRPRCEEILRIQSHALAQRLQHTGSKCAVLGISGGLDSTLALLVAVKAFDLLGLDRKGIHGITMPGFGTSGRTYNNALKLMQELGITWREISIAAAVKQHFLDIGLKEGDRSAAYENSQARERTQILMDYANKVGGMVIGTGDLSELALGWATYNGDQMSMYGVNAAIPKTLVRDLVRHWAEHSAEPIKKILLDVVDTPVSPELLPTDAEGNIAQKTEDLVGPYELHDFMLFHFLRRGFGPAKLFMAAQMAFGERYTPKEILHWMRILFKRFFSQQFKRSAMPDGPKVGSVGLSPRGDWQMPSDGSPAAWLAEIETLETKLKNEL